jgi:hypothetical protein
MRKMMYKEVTQTVIHIAKLGMNEEGLPVAEKLEPITVLGELTKDKAQKTVNKTFGLGATIYNLEVVTNTYELEVEEFIKVARIKTSDEVEIDDSDESDDEEPEITPPPSKKRVTIIPKEQA